MSKERTIVGAGDARPGERGETILARGDKLYLRKWESEPAGETSPPHSNPYEFVAYVLSGRVRVRVGDAEPRDLGPGDSWAVPVATPYSFEVLETASVVEAVSR